MRAASRSTVPARRGLTRIVFWPFGLFGNPGAEAGVAEVSEALLGSLAEHAAEPASRLREIARRAKVEVCDYREVEDFLGWRDDVRRRFARCLRRGELPVFFGGNHLVALPVLEAYAALGARVAFVSFDAHLDAYDLASAREPLHHGNFLLHLRKWPGLGLVNVGERDHVLAPSLAREIFDRIVPMEEIAARPLEAVVARLVRYLRGFDLVHLDIDLDVLDPSVLPAVGTPLPCGLTAQQLLAFAAALVTPRLAGLTISEYSAPLDRDGSGRQLLVWLLEDILLRRWAAPA